MPETWLTTSAPGLVLLGAIGSVLAMLLIALVRPWARPLLRRMLLMLMKPFDAWYKSGWLLRTRIQEADQFTIAAYFSQLLARLIVRCAFLVLLGVQLTLYIDSLSAVEFSLTLVTLIAIEFILVFQVILLSMEIAMAFWAQVEDRP